jgi:hypothetical protein
MNKADMLKMLRETKSEDEWDLACDRVKEETKKLPPAERSGEYPAWWFPEVLATGLIEKIAAGWK